MLEIMSESVKIPPVLIMIEYSTFSLLASQQIPHIYVPGIIKEVSWFFFS